LEMKRYIPTSKMFHKNLVDMLRDLNSIKSNSIMKGLVVIMSQNITRHNCKDLKSVVIIYGNARRNLGDN
jgi:hypothetical protein